MQKLRIIENELVPVYETENGKKVIYGKDLHNILLVKTDFSTWIKRRLNECDATEKTDYVLLPKIEEQVSGTKHSIEYVIKLDIAKEMAMLERNEKGKQVRRYFIQVEEKYKQNIIDRRQLSPQMQMFYAIADNQAKVEIEQKRQAEQLNRIEQKQVTIVQTFSKETVKDFRSWVKQCITTISESQMYHFVGTKPEKYQAVTKESYDRLNKKKPCRLKQRVESEKGRALTAGASTARVNSINKLTIIENDKALKPIYETVLKEMMITYCVEPNFTKERG